MFVHFLGYLEFLNVVEHYLTIVRPDTRRGRTCFRRAIAELNKRVNAPTAAPLQAGECPTD